VFVRLTEWSLAHLKGVSYAVQVAGKYPRKYSLKCQEWTDVPDADAALLDAQHPKRLTISKTATNIKKEKVTFANIPRTKGADPQNPKAFTKPAKKKVTAQADPDMPEVPDENEEIEADDGTADTGDKGAGDPGKPGT
jgi:hypothetical protein